MLLDYVYQAICSENNNTTNCNNLQEPTNNLKIMKLVAYAMERNDCLLHISIYEWLLEHDMISELLNISEESLGEFLRRLAMNNKDNIKIIDVLWKYYEKKQQHSSAANILNNLATIKCNSINLDQRIEYLARAVMCMRNDNTGYSATNGALLRDYEDKVSILWKFSIYEIYLIRNFCSWKSLEFKKYCWILYFDNPKQRKRTDQLNI